MFVPDRGYPSVILIGLCPENQGKGGGTQGSDVTRNRIATWPPLPLPSLLLKLAQELPGPDPGDEDTDHTDDDSGSLLGLVHGGVSPTPR